MRLQRLIRVYTCQNATLLEISCSGSYHFMFSEEMLVVVDTVAEQIQKTKAFIEDSV